MSAADAAGRAPSSPYHEPGRDRAPDPRTSAGCSSWVWVGAFCAVIALLGVARDLYRLGGEAVTARVRMAVITTSLVSPALWAALCVVAFHVARRTRPRRRRDVLAIVATGVGLTTAHYLLELLLATLLHVGDAAPRRLTLMADALITFPTSLMISMSLLSAGLAVMEANLRQQQEEQASRLSADLARAQLDTLEHQLQPHFLFNSLQSVATLMHRDGAAAREMLHRLRLLLEHGLRAQRDSEIPLREEMRLVRLYTDIEAVRFGERLRLDFDVDPAAQDVRVPVFLLQPLVENAVRHALELSGGGTVRVRARCDGDRLHLLISDTGAPARSDRPRRSFGIGLSNTRSRLSTLYGSQHELRIGRSRGGGTVVRITIPARS